MFENATSRTAPLAEAEIVIGGELVTTVAAMVEGEYINWEGALAFDTDNEKALKFFRQLNNIRAKRYKGDRKYSPVIITDVGDIQGAVMSSDIPKEVKQLGDVTEEPETQGGARLRVLSCETEASQVAPDRETNQTVPQSTHSQSEGSETQTQEVAETVTGDRGSPQTTDSREDSAEEDDAGITDDVLAVGEESYDEEEGEGEQGSAL